MGRFCASAPSLSQLCVFFGAICLRTAAAQAEASDFVIVGGGTAGCVLAGRLCAALPQARITLLERGFERNEAAEFLVRSPRQAFDATFSELVSEVWPSLPNPGLFGNEATIATGNTLGGSSSINAMQWTLPIEGTVGKWNISGLSDNTALKYYRRAYRKVGFARPPRSLRQIYADEYVKASTKAGFTKEFDPFNQSPRAAVWQHTVASTKTGRRIDSCTAYVSPVLNNKCKRNLRLMQGVTVTRLILNDQRPRRVTGVEYVLSKDKDLTNKKKILVKEEVLMAAGPFGSPKLLQLSGIGPKDHLQALGIQQRVNIGVGIRTQARALNVVTSVYTGVPLEPSNNSTLLNSDEARERWENGKSSVLGVNPAAVINTLNRGSYAAMATGSLGPGIDVPVMTSFCLGNPSSFGYLRIKDANPFTPPDVHLNILGKQRDLKRLRRCAKKIVEVHRKFPSSFQVSVTSPAEGVTEQFLRNTSSHAYHFVGGCAVGTVLRGDLRVHGVEGLRVIDASVFKSMPFSAGPMASTYMLAEFVSERISKLYRRKFQ